MLATFDADGDGVVTKDELIAGLTRHASGPPPLGRLLALRPPPSGNAAFAELVRAGGPLEVPNAEERAISLGQLKKTFTHASRRCKSEGWLVKRLVDGVWSYSVLEPCTINLYDLASHIILPTTHGRMLPDGSTQPSFVELMADGPQQPDYFVSHCEFEPKFCCSPAGSEPVCAPTTSS